MQIHANCRIRRVYFSDRLYSEEELPAEFKLYLPVQQKQHAGMNLKYGSEEKGSLLCKCSILLGFFMSKKK